MKMKSSQLMADIQALSFDIVGKTLCSQEEKVLSVLKKAEKGKGLSLKDTAVLLNADEYMSDQIFKAAKSVNEKLYKKVLTFYGVSYISDECINVCSYCGDNVYSQRKGKYTLSLEEFRKDLASLLRLHNFKQICFLAGEHKKRV